MFEVYALILIGRLIYGFACGLQCLAAMRYIEETVPFEQVRYMIPLFVVSFTVGKLLVVILAAGMPADDDGTGLYVTGYWRFILSFPLIIYAG